MAIDLWTSAKTRVANWSSVSVTPDITFEKSGAAAHTHAAADISSLSQSGGEREMEGIPVFGGKRITFEKPQADIEWSFDVAFTTTFFDSMLMDTAYSAGAQILNTTTRSRWRVIITWQDPEALTQAAAEKLRWILKDAVIVSFEPEMSADEYVRGKITLRAPAFDSSGNSNLIKEHEAGGSSFTTLAAAHGGAEDSYTYVG